MIRKVVWVVPMLLIASGQVSSQELYRYVDKDGITILNSSIPVEYVNSGYEIIDPQGQVIQVVLPQTAEAAKPELVVEKSDTILMASYSNVVEIEEHRDRKIESIEREIDNIESDRRVLGMQLEKETAELHRLLRLQEKEDLKKWQADQLPDLETQVEEMTDTALKLRVQLQRRSQDIVAIQNEYALKVERFIQLEQADVDVRHTSIQNAD